MLLSPNLHGKQANTINFSKEYYGSFDEICNKNVECNLIGK